MPEVEGATVNREMCRGAPAASLPASTPAVRCRKKLLSMSTPLPSDPIVRARLLLHGHSPETLAAAEDFFSRRDGAALDRLVLGILAYHLPACPDDKADLAALPPSTRLFEDLTFDSLSAVEMSFLLQDLFEVQIPNEDIQGLRTIADLRDLVRRRVPLT